VARVAGKVVLLTRAADRVVQACAQALIDEGAHVALADTDASKADQAAATLTGAGDGIISLGKEEATDEGWLQALAAIETRFGGVDVLVNGPPQILVKSIADMTLEDLRALEETNVVEPWLGLKHGIPALRKRGGGSIINLSLTLARDGAANMSGNCATAAGSRVMSQAAALECGEQSDGVRVNSILLDHDASVPEEVAAAVVYLASDESRFMTAGEIALDGAGAAK